MKILDRYIGRAVASGTAIALLVVVGLDVFFSVVSEIDQVGENNYTLLTMLQYVALTIPHGMYELFPMAALLGGLMGMGALAASSELVAMRASGLSVWRIVRSVLQAGLIMLVVAVLIGEVLAPAAQQYAQQLRVSAMEKTVTFLGSHGLWVRDGNHFVYARRVLDKEKLAEVSVYEIDNDGRLAMATTAATASHHDGGWELGEVRQTAFSGEGVEKHYHEQQSRQALVTPDLLGIVALKPQTMSVVDIDRFVDYLEDNGLDSGQYRYAFWGRLATPLAALVMLFIAVPFVFGSLRSVGTGQRLFVGMMVGFGFYLVSQVASQMGQVYAISPLIAAFVPSLVFIAFGVYGMRRV